MKREGKIASLEEWLEIATKGLAKTARERVTGEIESHYREAVEAHLAKGKPEVVARAAALMELGNPVKAAARFTAEHVTEADEKFLAYLHTTAFKPWRNRSVMTCFLVLVLIVLVNLTGMGYAEASWDFFFQKHPDFMLAATLVMLLITCALLPGYSYVAVRQSSLRAVTSRRLLNIELLRWSILGTSWFNLMESPHRGLSCLITIILMDRSSRLKAKRRKQRKSGAGQPGAA